MPRQVPSSRLSSRKRLVLNRAMSKAPAISTRRSLSIALLRTREAVMQHFRPHLSELGLTEQQWRVLRVLGEDGPHEAGRVARRACVLPPSLSRILKTLSELGYVSSGPHRDDARRSVISLTPLGEKKLRNALPRSAEIYSNLEQRIGPAQLQRLLDMLEDVQGKL